jgi:hypothetical protein
MPRESRELPYKHNILHFDHPLDLLEIVALLKANRNHLSVKTVALSSKWLFYEEIRADDADFIYRKWEHFKDLQNYTLSVLFPNLKKIYV